MDLIILSILYITVGASIARGLHLHSPPGQMRSSLLVQVVMVLLGGCLRIADRLLSRLELTALGSTLDTMGNLALAGGATIGLSILTYIATGRWRRGYYFLSLIALLPGYGATLSALLWLGLPLLARTRVLPAPDAESRVMVHTLSLGTAAGGSIFFLMTLFRFTDAAPFSLEPLGALVSVLFLYAGLHARRDPENEFVHPEVVLLVKAGLGLVVGFSLLPALVLDAPHASVLFSFLAAASLLVSCVFLVILCMHFDSSAIRTFMILMIAALAPLVVIHLYHENLASFALTGLKLVSRIALVLACLFILKQYMTWGFEIAQAMVMVTTAIAAASIVFLVMYVLQPEGFLGRFAEETLLDGAILVLDLVILSSLPPVLVNYRLGTMRVTWAILAFGIFFLVYADILPSTALRRESESVHLLGHGLMALSFATLWRYTNAMIRRIDSIARSLEES